MNILSNLKQKSAIIAGGSALLAGAAVSFIAYAGVTGALLPSSDGTYLQWTSSVGTTHYTMVDEALCNGTADYNYTNTVGRRDSYGVNLSSIPHGATITDITITPCASRNNSGTGGSATVKIFYRFNGTNGADAGNYALTGTTPVQLAPTTFNGLSLTKGPSSTLQIGAVYSAGTKGARLSRITATVTYVSLTAPSNLDAANVSENQNNLSWSDNSSNENGYKIERSANKKFGPFTEIASTTANATSYTDNGLSADQTYYYRVRAFNSGANSWYSNTDYAITATVVPNNPSGLTAVASSSSAVLNWTDNSLNEEGFKVERSPDGVNFAEMAVSAINASSHTDTGLAPGTYYYRVRAFNAVGNSTYSNTATTTIP